MRRFMRITYNSNDLGVVLLNGLDTNINVNDLNTVQC